MITISAYTKTAIYQLHVKQATLTRRYEDDDYSFVAGDIDFELNNARDVYDLLVAGERLEVVVKDGDTQKFLGVLKYEGAGYDPETEAFSITAVHIAKEIFERFESRNFYDQKITSFNFDRNIFYRATQCDLLADTTITEGTKLGLASESKQYNVRDYVIDLAKVNGMIMHVADERSENKLPTIVYENRAKKNATLHIGYDEYIAEYKTENHTAQYDAVFFPCNMIQGGEPYTCFCLYTREKTKLFVAHSKSFPESLYEGVYLEQVKIGDEIKLPENVLNLCVPDFLYDGKMPSQHSITPIPTFTYIFLTDEWTETPQAYCDRTYYSAIQPYEEANVLYSQLIPVQPDESISVQGDNIVIAEIEDNLVDETTRIIARKYL